MNASKSIFALGLASALVFSSGTALAGPGPHGSLGLSGLLNPQLHQQLSLTPAQETQWQALVTEKASLRTQNHTNRQQLQTTISTELAKPTPELTTINTAVNTTRDAAVAGGKQLRQDFLTFYAALSPDRQAIVITALKERLAQAKSHRWAH